MDFSSKLHSENSGVTFKAKHPISSDFTFIGSLPVKKNTKVTDQL